MNGRKWHVAVLCVSSLALCAPRAHPQTAAQSQKRVETPMATDERAEAPGWWPTKGSTSRQDFVGTAGGARCHAKPTASQVINPKAHAATSASSSDQLHDYPQLNLEPSPYCFTITTSVGADV